MEMDVDSVEEKISEFKAKKKAAALLARKKAKEEKKKRKEEAEVASFPSLCFCLLIYEETAFDTALSKAKKKADDIIALVFLFLSFRFFD